MNRPIKFRAWDGERMSYNPEAWCESLNEVLRATEGMTYLQFTGLTDKNGKEVYEGDIVLHIGEPWQVEFKMGSYWLLSADGKACAPLGTDVGSAECEVIGNIYEDPDLIN